jgi:hypothetical protein
MEACRCVEFTDIELAGGTKLAAPVEKTVTGPVEAAAVAPVEKTGRTLEKTAVGKRRHGEGGRGQPRWVCDGDVGQRLAFGRRGGAAESCRNATVESLLERQWCS